jgi:transposase
MMTPEAFYEELLDIRLPWTVVKVEMNKAARKVDVHLAHRERVKWKCPRCGKEHATYDHTRERVWRHLDSCEYATYLHARLPRVECQGEYFQLPAPWAEGGSRFTVAQEQRCIDTLQECDVSGAERLTGLGWSSLWLIVEWAVARGQARKVRALPERLGVDEKSFGKFHRYETLVYDLEGSTVEYVADDRTQESLTGYFKQFTPTELAQVKAVAMDMWEPYIAAVKDYIPGAEQKIVFDRFHAMQFVTNAVDQTRRQEHKELSAQKDLVLAKTRYLWLWNEENIPERRREEFAALKQENLKVGRAWILKEFLRGLWGIPSMEDACDFFKRWYYWATHSRLPAMVKAAKTLKAHATGVLNFVVHGITNACAEGLNSKIETVKRMACGFRNRAHYRTMIYFHCGGLNMSPAYPAS